MAKKFRYQHIKSSVEGKAPTPEQLKVAEIGVNDFAEKEQLFIKNSSGDVVPFSSDEYYTKEKLGEYFIDEGSAKTVTDVLIEKERVTAEALLDLDRRKADIKDTVWEKGAGDNSAVLAGCDNAANKSCAVAEGRNTVADGQCSHAEGYNTKANQYGSHAEGDYTIASGYYSHAEGDNTLASGEASHAEG